MVLNRGYFSSFFTHCNNKAHTSFIILIHFQVAPTVVQLFQRTLDMELANHLLNYDIGLHLFLHKMQLVILQNIPVPPAWLRTEHHKFLPVLAPRHILSFLPINRPARMLHKWFEHNYTADEKWQVLFLCDSCWHTPYHIMGTKVKCLRKIACQPAPRMVEYAHTTRL